MFSGDLWSLPDGRYLLSARAIERWDFELCILLALVFSSGSVPSNMGSMPHGYVGSPGMRDPQEYGIHIYVCSPGRNEVY